MKKIFSVIVTYNFDDSLFDNIKNISIQSQLLIIDNSINDIMNEKLQIISEKYKNIKVIYNKENMGLSYSYNLALKYAKEGNYDYFVTFDQDTHISENTLLELIELMDKYNLDSIGPNFRKISKYKDTELSFPKFIISSCNITKMQVYDKIQYDDNLFIDNIDLDFCLLLKKYNYRFAMANNIFITHSIGEKYTGKFGIEFYAHSPKRYYYIYRNYYILKRKYNNEKYLRRVNLRLFVFKYFVLYLFKKKDRKKAISYINTGIQDGKAI